MKTLEYTTIDKSAWGAGPWMTEPDKRQWRDAATGLPCLIVRGPIGALCGYVGVAEDHSLFGKSYGDVDLSCHGGLTFSASCNPAETVEHGICHIPGEGEPDHVWWFGFDAGHCFDLAPKMAADMREARMSSIGNDGVYRDMAYMTASVAWLAAQLQTVK